MEFTRPFWLPPLLAVIILGAYYALVGQPGFPGRTFFLLLLLAAFVVMAIITPLPIFTRKKTDISVWYPLALAFLCALVLLGRFLLAGSIETYAGREYPHFEYRFPVLGNILDIVVISLGMRKIAYFPPGYEVVLWAGLFIEIILVSAIIYAVVSSLSLQEKRPDTPRILYVLLISCIIAIPWLITELEFFLSGGELGPRPWGFLSIVAFLATIIVPVVYGWKTHDTRGAVIIGVVPFLFSMIAPRVLFGMPYGDTLSFARSVLAIVSLSVVGGMSGYYASLHEKKAVVLAIALAMIWILVFLSGIN